jgi:tetratricopeptide (TPR) repeat protein
LAVLSIALISIAEAGNYIDERPSVKDGSYKNGEMINSTQTDFNGSMQVAVSTQSQQTAEYWIKIGNELNGFEYIDVNRSKEAVKAFDKAIDIDPSNRDAWMGLKDALRKIVVSTNYNEEYERQSDNVYALLEHLRNISDLRCAPALSDHANRTAYYSMGDNEPKYATKYDVVEALNGSPYFKGVQNYIDRVEVDYDNRIEVDLNMTTNISDSERASRLVFEALFKNPLVNEVEIECFKFEVYFTVPGTMSLHHYEMTRADAEDVNDWINLDLRRYDSMYHESVVETLEGFGVKVPSNAVVTGNSVSW